MSLLECRTAEDVRALAKAVRERKRKQLTPPPKKRFIAIQDLTPSAVEIDITFIETPLIEEVISEATQPECPSLADIVSVVCERFRVSRMDLISHRRPMNLVLPRQIAMGLAKKLTPHSLPVIGRHLGGRDHTTILHGVRRIEAMRAGDADIDRVMTELEQTLGGVNAVTLG